MSEYGERHSVARLIGAPPGYVGYDEGGHLTESVRRHPYSVVLFDEIEKAHPDVWNSLLQILDEGRMTDGHGRTVDFRNTVIIMTSNLGTQYLSQGGSLGFRTEGKDKAQREKTRKDIEAELRRTFRPEFLNRIDDTVIFQQLSRAEVLQIVDLEVRKVAQRISEKSVAIELTDAARSWLAEQGYDPQFGARPLKRAIQHHLENPLSKRLIGGEFTAGSTVLVDLDGDELVFKQKAVAAPVPA